MRGKPNPGGPELDPSELAVARQGRLPGGGGLGALAVLGKESRRGEGGGGGHGTQHTCRAGPGVLSWGPRTLV